MASILRFGASMAAALALLPAGAPAGATGNGLYGTVKKGPIRPVCSASEPCDAPARVTLFFTRMTYPAGGTATTYQTVRSDKLGRYRISLSPGYYRVRSGAKVGLTKLPKPHAVHVRAGHWDKINLFFDTGIR